VVDAQPVRNHFLSSAARLGITEAPADLKAQVGAHRETKLTTTDLPSHSKAKGMRILIFLSMLVLHVILTACSSLPIRPIPESTANSEIASFGTVAIIGCKDYQAISNYELDCQGRSKQLADMFERTELFTEVLIGRSDADYWVELNPYSRYPYYASMGHNPGFLYYH